MPMNITIHPAALSPDARAKVRDWYEDQDERVNDDLLPFFSEDGPAAPHRSRRLHVGGAHQGGDLMDETLPPADLESTEMSLDEIIAAIQRNPNEVFLVKRVVLMSPKLYADLKRAGAEG